MLHGHPGPPVPKLRLIDNSRFLTWDSYENPMARRNKDAWPLSVMAWANSLTVASSTRPDWSVREGEGSISVGFATSWKSLYLSLLVARKLVREFHFHRKRND